MVTISKINCQNLSGYQQYYYYYLNISLLVL